MLALFASRDWVELGGFRWNWMLRWANNYTRQLLCKLPDTYIAHKDTQETLIPHTTSMVPIMFGCAKG